MHDWCSRLIVGQNKLKKLRIKYLKNSMEINKIINSLVYIWWKNW